MSLQDVFKKLEAGIADLSTLEVQTFTGTLSADVQSSGNGDDNIINWPALLAKAKTQGSVSLAASTVVYFDGDSNNFFTSAQVPQQILDSHKASVQAGIAIRQGLLSMFSDLIGVNPPKPN